MTKIKDLAKCKHPNSRKTKALTKQILKKNARDKSKLSGNIKSALIGEKLSWFQDHLNSDLSVYTPINLVELIKLYLERFNEELDQIKLKHSIGNRKNRQHASREDVLKMTVEREQKEFESCGLEVPDLLNVGQLNMLKSWNGELRYLPNFILKRYSQEMLDKEQRKYEDKPLKKQEKLVKKQESCMDVDC